MRFLAKNQSRFGWLCGLLAFIMGSAHVSAQAEIELIDETSTTLTLRFVDAQSNGMTIDFVKPDASWNYWITSTQGGTIGIIHGNQNPVLPDLDAIKEAGEDPRPLLQTMDSAIALEDMDDITIVRLPGSILAIGLWDGNAISAMYLVGTGVANDLVADNGPICTHLWAKCNGSENGQNQPPYYDVFACALAAENCEGLHDASCTRLTVLCIGDSDPEDPTVPDDGDNNACDSWFKFCQPEPAVTPPTVEDWLEAIHDILKEIFRWLQEQAE